MILPSFTVNLRDITVLKIPLRNQTHSSIYEFNLEKKLFPVYNLYFGDYLNRIYGL
jgi:hypothetical protein